jgi:hypothetical protein
MVGQYYHLDVKVNPKTATITGSNTIKYQVSTRIQPHNRFGEPLVQSNSGWCRVKV